MTGFEPNYTVLSFLALKQFAYLPAILALAVLRAIAAEGPSRAWAAAAGLLSCAGIFALFGPAVLGLWSGPVHAASSTLARAGGGMVVLLAATAPLGLSGLACGMRWRWIDWAHGLLVLALLLLWLLTR
ncbi:hypothetical protein [Rhodosalinus sp. 5P4]|uniref:hypothetical protein n=1 Tax=Rhodosalinus sp. 5P4 TaxID=3239196 RepID=UPI003526662C